MNTRIIPYGYKMEKGVLLINKDEAEQVRRIFKMRINGTGVYAIGKMLFEEQISFFADTRDKAIKKQALFSISRSMQVQRTTLLS